MARRNNNDCVWVGGEEGYWLCSGAGLALTEKIPRRKRFQLYRALALYLGYTDRTQLPTELEEAIRCQWSDPNETLVGFRTD
ncbi:hypothetical protein R1sor_013316 [Riccia sorocarpa]|uniref:Uncharacterized protein n=1 Tax=Riccia sorocarpa TaxID=122646 RepID=A0ABD3H8V4_9MARC